MKSNQPIAIVLYSLHRGGELARAKENRLSWQRLPPRLSQTFPKSLSQVPQQQHLYGAARGSAPQEPGGKHTGIVHNQAVARQQVVCNVKKVPVFHCTRDAIQHQ